MVDAHLVDMGASGGQWCLHLLHIRDLVELLALRSANSQCKHSQRAARVIETLHNLVRMPRMMPANGRLTDRFVETGTRVLEMVDRARTGLWETACGLVLEAARVYLQTHVYKFERPHPSHLPLDACISRVQVFVPDQDGADVYLLVDRNDLVQSSMAEMGKISRYQWDMCQTMDVCFVRETGYGEGVVREWLGALAQEVFSDSSCFVEVPNRPRTFYPQPCRSVHDAAKMRFAGQVLGLALKLDVPTGIHLAASTWNLMASRSVDLRDLAEADPQLHRTCRAIMNASSAEELAAMGFSGFLSTYGQELFPGSSRVPVTLGNRGTYVRLLATEVLLRQAHSAGLLLDGMMHILHSQYRDHLVLTLKNMRPAEINGRVGGRIADDEIDVAAWRAVTHIECLDDENRRLSTEIRVRIEDAFFDVVQDMDQEQRRLLLRFWTGLHALPQGGFARLRPQPKVAFRILRKNPAGIATSQTCVMLLVLRVYQEDPDEILVDPAHLKASLARTLARSFQHMEFYDDEV
jgi:hypothetical protein